MKRSFSVLTGERAGALLLALCSALACGEEVEVEEGFDAARADAATTDRGANDVSAGDTGARDAGGDAAGTDASDRDGARQDIGRPDTAGADSATQGCTTASCNLPGPHFPLADTNQRLCSAAEEVMESCPAEGEDYFGQDAQYGWDTSHEASARFTRSSGDEPVVVDNVTGLSWQGCVAGRRGDACASGMPSDKSWAQAMSYCADLSWGGHDDWALPDVHELHSIVDLGRFGPSIDPTAFPLAPALYHWTSAVNANSVDSSRAVHLDLGLIGAMAQDSVQVVRCARRPSAQPLAQRTFSRVEAESGEWEVSDSVTGLVWQGCTAGSGGAACDGGSPQPLTWLNALDYCEGLTWGGHGDWRLPNVKELASLLDFRRASPAIDTTAFPSTAREFYWTSTTYAFSSAPAWVIDFGPGNAAISMKGIGAQLRCVRAGP